MGASESVCATGNAPSQVTSTCSIEFSLHFSDMMMVRRERTRRDACDRGCSSHIPIQLLSLSLSSPSIHILFF